MSREFMNVCAHERERLHARIASTEKVLGLYRELWKNYAAMEKADEPARRPIWKQAKAFIEETLSPILKAELALYRESLEAVTRAQELGCMEIGVASGN